MLVYANEMRAIAMKQTYKNNTAHISKLVINYGGLLFNKVYVIQFSIYIFAKLTSLRTFFDIITRLCFANITSKG